MLKLMRLEGTCVFAIVDDEQFESEMDILGYVRMNYKDGLHFTKTFGEHDEEWFKELNKAIKEKEKELVTGVKCVRKKLNLENIVIQYLRVKKRDTVKIGIVKKLLLYLSSEIHTKGLTFNFKRYYQLDAENIKKQLQECNHLTVDGGHIRINNYMSDIQCFNPNTAVDFRIMEMIREFIAKEKK